MVLLGVLRNMGFRVEVLGGYWVRRTISVGFLGRSVGGIC